MEDQGKKANKSNGKRLVESDEIIRKDFNTDRDSIPLEEEKKYSMNLLKKNLLDLGILKKMII